MTGDFDPSDFERPVKAPDYKVLYEQLEAQVRTYCAAIGVEVSDLVWNGGKLGAALKTLMRADLQREAEHLEREAANMKHRASILLGAAEQLRAFEEAHKKGGAR